MADEKKKIIYPIIVEGKYDRLKILSLYDANVITTDGFSIFNEKEKTAVIRALAEKTKIIVLTDSDGAGGVIRSHIKSSVAKDALIQLYIPQIEGKEKRKKEPSKEGSLGVEGMTKAVLSGLLDRFTENGTPNVTVKKEITKADFYADGLSGGNNSKERRNELAKKFGLPPDMTPNALLSALNIITTHEEYEKVAR